MPLSVIKPLSVLTVVPGLVVPGVVVSRVVVLSPLGFVSQKIQVYSEQSVVQSFSLYTAKNRSTNVISLRTWCFYFRLDSNVSQ